MSRVPNEGTMGNMDAGGQEQQQSGSLSVCVENPTLRTVRDAAEIRVILHTLEHTGWNRKRAAVLLKISYRGLLYKIRRHSITPTTGR
jgi:DNA-binding NtrC family response regulator